MKKLTLLIVLAFQIQITATSQSCLPEGITFTSQAQIDNFQTNYPGCTEIEGGVEIGGWYNNVTNLNGLSVLNSIGGNLKLLACDSLISLEGLDNLISVGGDVEIIHVDSITNLSGLEGLTSIGGDLWIQYNDDLVDLAGIENIDPGSINNLHIWVNPSLSTCHVQSICEYLANPNGTINIHENAVGCNTPPEIANACGFNLSCLPYGNYYLVTQDDIGNFQTDYQNCSEIVGDVVVEIFDGSTNITNLSGLNNISSIDGNLKINKNDFLTSLVGLEGLTTLQGSIIIGAHYSSPSGNAELSSLKGLDNITSIEGNLEIAGNDKLNDLSNLNRLTHIAGDLIISRNDILSNLVGLDSLITLGGSLNISGNLESLTGLEGLTKIIADVTINGTNSLNNLTGLDNITSIGGTLYVDHNTTLNSFHGMESLGSIGGDLLIGDNGDAIYHGNLLLNKLSGLENLYSIEGDLVIAYSDSLINLIGLDNLKYVGGGIDIHGIPSLISLKGLDYLDSIGENIRINDNISLSTCNIQSICDYLASPNGTIEIHDNASGCNSHEEVQDSCWASVEEREVFIDVKIHPNTFFQVVNIEYELMHPTTVQITIYSHFGKQLEVIRQKQSAGKQQVIWNAEGLPSGVYFCVLKTESRTQTMKMIKLK